MEAFDPDLNRWTVISGMVRSRTACHRAVAVRNKVYAFGGDEQQNTFSVGVCDVKDGKFALLSRVTLLHTSGKYFAR